MRCLLQPDIPHIDEHVSKVECIGVKTQQKLLDIKGAAAAVGIQDLNVIHNSITTGGRSTAARNGMVLQGSPSGHVGQNNPSAGGQVAAASIARMRLRLSCSQKDPLCGHNTRSAVGQEGAVHLTQRLCIAVGQFKELVLSAERDQPLQEHLRKVLNLTAKGWEEAARHALRAVSTDNRMRMWLADDAASTGLLFRCTRGRIALDNPVGAPRPAKCCLMLLGRLT